MERKEEEISLVKEVLNLPGAGGVVGKTKIKDGKVEEAKKRQEESLIEELEYMKDMEEEDENVTKIEK